MKQIQTGGDMSVNMTWHKSIQLRELFSKLTFSLTQELYVTT